jgi:hypothetical protein
VAEALLLAAEDGSIAMRNKLIWISFATATERFRSLSFLIGG